LSATIVYQRGRNPEAAVHLYIDRTGRLIKYDMIRPSADKLFNSSVIRAIEKAKADFPPVPSGTGFDKLYVFSPQEVSN
jgi:colicin import membrane protein